MLIFLGGLVSFSASKTPAPAVLSMAPSVSDLFTGRESYLLELSNFFSDSSTSGTRRKALVCGMGGVGKTQICLKFLDMCSNL